MRMSEKETRLLEGAAGLLAQERREALTVGESGGRPAAGWPRAAMEAARGARSSL